MSNELALPNDLGIELAEPINVNTRLIDKSSHSEVEAFLMCERRHYYSYGMKIQGKGSNDSLIRGTVGHAVLAQYYQGLKLGMSHKDAKSAAYPLIRQLIAENEPFDEYQMNLDLMLILESYWRLFEHDNWEILHVEVAYNVKLTVDFEMPVIIDLIARIPGHGVVALDHKFPYDFFNIDKIDLSPQLPKYYAALQALGIHVDEIWLNELRTRSTKDNKLDPSLRFRRTPIPLKPKKVVTIMREQIMAAKRIGQLKRMELPVWESKVLRNPQACNMCSFTSLCSAELDGEDADLVLHNFYEDKHYR
jgi:hypothetical protein